MHQVERVEQLGRDRHGAEDARAPLLQALEHDDAARQVDALGGQPEGLGDAAAGGVQHAAEGAHLAPGLGSGGAKGAALLFGQVEAAAFAIMQLHPLRGGPGCGFATVHRHSVSRRAGRRHGKGAIIPGSSPPGGTRPGCPDTELAIV